MKKEFAIKIFDKFKHRFRFRDYYKYTFYFVAEDERLRMIIAYGGNADNIYRFGVHGGNEIEDFSDMKLYDDFHYWRIEDKKNGNKIDHYYYW